MSSQKVFLFDQPLTNTRAIKPMNLYGININTEHNLNGVLTKKEYKEEDEFLRLKFNFTDKFNSKLALNNNRPSVMNTSKEPILVKIPDKTFPPTSNKSTKTEEVLQTSSAKPTISASSVKSQNPIKNIIRQTIGGSQRSQTISTKPVKRGKKAKFSQQVINSIASEPDTDSDDNRKNVIVQHNTYKDLPSSSSNDNQNILLKLKITGKKQTCDNILYTVSNQYIEKDIILIAALNINLVANREYTLKVRKMSEIETRIIFLLNNIVN
jgi:hypothetical protein